MMNERTTLNDMTQRQLTRDEELNLALNLERVERDREALSNMTLGQVILLAPISFFILFIINLIIG